MSLSEEEDCIELAYLSTFLSKLPVGLNERRKEDELNEVVPAG